MGALFDEGLGVPRDSRAAASWFARLAEHGDIDAKLALVALSLKGVAEATAAFARLVHLGLATEGTASAGAAAAGGAAEALGAAAAGAATERQGK